MNFKVRVVENIGRNGESLFGDMGTVLDVVNGHIIDKTGSKWNRSDCDVFKDIQSLNNYFLNTVHKNFRTKFELYEDMFQKSDIISTTGCQSLMKVISVSKFGYTLQLQDKDGRFSENSHELTLSIGDVRGSEPKLICRDNSKRYKTKDACIEYVVTMRYPEVTVYALDRMNDIQGFGKAVCNTKLDNFDKDKGVEIAMKRAENDLYQRLIAKNTKEIESIL